MSGAVEAAAFDARYAADPDPWDYETSAYEDRKFSRTLASLPERIGGALEIGCSNGVLASRLAPRCRELLAVDYSAEAVRLADERLAGEACARVSRHDLRAGIPAGPWDAIVASEVLYYLPREQVESIRDEVAAALEPGGSFLAVHWLGRDPDAPLTGPDVHDILRERLDSELVHVDGEVDPAGYMLDRWERPRVR